MSNCVYYNQAIVLTCFYSFITCICMFEVGKHQSEANSLSLLNRVSHFAHTSSNVCGSDIYHFIYYKNEFPKFIEFSCIIYYSCKQFSLYKGNGTIFRCICQLAWPYIKFALIHTTYVLNLK